jgi:hypothetical protein
VLHDKDNKWISDRIDQILTADVGTMQSFIDKVSVERVEDVAWTAELKGEAETPSKTIKFEIKTLVINQTACFSCTTTCDGVEMTVANIGAFYTWLPTALDVAIMETAAAVLMRV